MSRPAPTEELVEDVAIGLLQSLGVATRCGHYTNKQISTAQMTAQLLERAKWVREARRHGEEFGP